MHECAGGVVLRSMRDETAFACDPRGSTRVFPGLVDADAYNARDWDLLHAHSRDLLTEWQIRERRRALP